MTGFRGGWVRDVRQALGAVAQLRATDIDVPDELGAVDWSSIDVLAGGQRLDGDGGH